MSKSHTLEPLNFLKSPERNMVKIALSSKESVGSLGNLPKPGSWRKPRCSRVLNLEAAERAAQSLRDGRFSSDGAALDVVG